ncbi:hypothetical protein BK004_01455 [bacterium CG10_46_32]|nr:MAG: hypothetical protein BK004_01455 [bacterium CG10_46_32]PIR56364.1 MAG: sugar dehydratase [Parcubacteria group bacterium CG10_big_fil_rev_8_21_14_0_10_46_32]
MQNFWKNRRVLITGANGFLAGWLAKDLVGRGANLTALIYKKNPVSVFETEKINRKSDVIYADILDLRSMKRIMKEHRIQTVFHLGAQAICQVAIKDPVGTLDANIRGTMNVLEAVRAVNANIHVVVASSDKAYGIHKKLPYLETYALHGEFPYEVSKSCADLISQMYYATYNIPICVIRSGNLYGGGDSHFSRIYPKTIYRLSRGLRPQLRDNSIRDYVYVEDAARAYRMVAEKMKHGLVGEVFNLGWNRPVSVLRVLRLIAKTMKKPHLKPETSNRSSSHIPKQYLSAAKIKKMVGWKAEISLEEGTKRTVAWYIDFLKTHKFRLHD